MFSANQKPFVICTRVTEELHSFLSQSELSNFFVCIIKKNNNNSVNPLYLQFNDIFINEGQKHQDENKKVKKMGKKRK